ncbi:MAG: hypothetical protein ACRDD2_07545 [Sarcina sp.]
MKKFIIPFYYTFYTRIKGKSKRIAYIFTFILPVYIYIIGFTKFSLNEFIASIIGFIGLMSIYEVGYIKNDVLTIKKEKNPTLRLTWDEIFYANEKMNKITLIKYLIGIIAAVILSYLGGNALYYAVALIVIDCIYLIHNFVRDRKSIITFFFLSLLRYITVPLIFLNVNLNSTDGKKLYTLVLTFALVIAIPRTIEKAAEKKYNIKKLFVIKRKTAEFRVIYYLIATLIGLLVMKLEASYLVLALYYLAYRFLIYLGSLIKGRKSI